MGLRWREVGCDWRETRRRLKWLCDGETSAGSDIHHTRHKIHKFVNLLLSRYFSSFYLGVFFLSIIVLIFNQLRVIIAKLYQFLRFYIKKYAINNSIFLNHFFFLWKIVLYIWDWLQKRFIENEQQEFCFTFKIYAFGKKILLTQLSHRKNFLTF